MKPSIPQYHPTLLVMLAVLLFAAPAWSMDEETPSWWLDAQDLAAEEGYGLIGHAELSELIQSEPELIILDVRSDYEFEAGHIPGAVNLEFDLGDGSGLDQDKKQALAVLLGDEPDRPVVVYCRSFR